MNPGGRDKQWRGGSRLAPWALLAGLALLSACGSLPNNSAPGVVRPVAPPQAPRNYVSLRDREQAHEVVMAAFGLIDIGYRFGGANPEAGLDCSGLITYVYERVTGLKLPHNAARIAEITRPVDKSALRPGDLVFFNTQGRSFSHVGLYIGANRFVHAPNSRARVKVSSLEDRYYAQHYEAARTVFID